MAQKRMFSLAVVDTDAFLDLPTSAQALYFHLGMHGDDDGFVASPKRIMRAVGCSEADLKMLVEAHLIFEFDSGVIAIADWRLNNTLKNDRYHETVYSAERSMLATDKSGRYFIRENDMEPTWNQFGTNLEPDWNPNVTQRNPTQRNPTEPNSAEGSAGGRGRSAAKAAENDPSLVAYLAMHPELRDSIRRHHEPPKMLEEPEDDLPF